MLTKSKSATWFKMALAVVLLLPCLLLFTACGGDPIEQDEALQALTEATTTSNYDNVKSFSCTMSTEASGEENGVTRTFKNSGKNIVYVTDTDTIVQVSISASMDIRANSGITMSSVTSGNGEYKIVKIGDSYYKINEGKKLYDTTTEEEFTSSSTILGSISMALRNVVTADKITQAGENVKMDLLKTGEGAYSLKFIFTETITKDEGLETEYVEKTVTSYYYEIADKKLTKYEIFAEVFEDDVRTGYEKYSFSINYSETKLTAPSSLDGYSEGEFNIGDLG